MILKFVPIRSDFNDYVPSNLPMNEPDLLGLKTEELKQWQRMAWQRIADPQFTSFEPRKGRDHLEESESALCATV